MEAWLDRIPLFGGLSNVQREALLDAAVPRIVRPGDVVLREGQEMDGLLYFLVSGEFQVSKLSLQGKETILRLIGAEEAFGLAALFDDNLAPATLTATKEGAVMRVCAAQFLSIMQADFPLTMRILKLLSGRLREAYQQLHLLNSSKARARLAQIILFQAERARPEALAPDAGRRIALNYSVLSRMAGISYDETVRILQEWTESLEYRRGEIRIKDLDALRAIADLP